MSKVLSKESLVAKILAKSASVAKVEDPNDEGTVAIPGGEFNEANSQLPSSKKNEGEVPEPSKTKKAPGDTSGVSDPKEKGTVAIPAAEFNEANSQLPASKKNEGEVCGSSASKSPEYSNDIAKRAAAIVGKIKGNKPSAPQAAPVKQAAAPVAQEQVKLNEHFTPEFHLKLASAFLQTEDGRKYIENVAKEALGAEIAANIVKAAAQQEHQFGVMQKIAAQEQQQAQLAHEVQSMIKSASAEDLKHMEKMAKVHGTNLARYTTDFEKAAYDQGVENAAMMQDMVDQGSPEDIGAAADTVSPEDLQAVLAQLVQEGKVSPEEADAIMAEFSAQSGGDPTAAGAGEPDGDEAAAGLGDQDGDEPEIAKAASLAKLL